MGPDTGRDFGTCVITADSHAEGTQPVLIDMLVILQTTSDSSLAQSRYTQCGIQTLPGDVLVILDNIIET